MLLQLGFFTPVKQNELFEDDFRMFRLNYEEDSLTFYSPELNFLVQVALKRRVDSKFDPNLFLRKGSGDLRLKKFPSHDKFDDVLTISPIQVGSPKSRLVEDELSPFEKRLSLEFPREKKLVKELAKRSSLRQDTSFKINKDLLNKLFPSRKASFTPLFESPRSPHSNGKPFPPSKLTSTLSSEKKKKRNLMPLTPETNRGEKNDVIMEGKLNQFLNNKWQPFHFILKLGGIVKKKSKDSMTPLQMIPLTDKILCQEVHVSGKKHCFSVFTGSNTFYFETSSEDLVNDWVDHITRAVEQTVMKSKNSMNFVQEAGISIDHNGDIYDLNEKAEHLFGYAPNEWIGKPYLEIFPQNMQPCYKHFIEMTEQETWNVLIKTNDGQVLPVEMIMRKLPSSLFENERILLEFVTLAGSYPPVMVIPQDCPPDLKEFFTKVYTTMNQEYQKLDEKVFHLQMTGSILQEQIEMYQKETEEKRRLQKIYQFEMEMSKEKNNMLYILQCLRSADLKFMEFCENSGCQNLLDFWTRAEGYRILLKDHEGYVEEAQSIYDMYFDQNSENKIISNPTVAGFIKQRLVKGDPDLFKSIQKDVLKRLDIVYKSYQETKIEKENGDSEEEDDIFK